MKGIKTGYSLICGVMPIYKWKAGKGVISGDS